MIGMGTPSSQSRIPRPMMNSSCVVLDKASLLVLAESHRSRQELICGSNRSSNGLTGTAAANVSRFAEMKPPGLMRRRLRA